MKPEQIKQMIENGLPGAVADVIGADGVHFEAHVSCAEFDGKSTLQRHRMVYRTLGEQMGREIHALSLKTQTPDEARS